MYMINIAFSALAILHLTYLGSVFNSSVDYMEEDEVRSTGSEEQSIFIHSTSDVYSPIIQRCLKGIYSLYSTLRSMCLDPGFGNPLKQHQRRDE